MIDRKKSASVDPSGMAASKMKSTCTLSSTIYHVGGTNKPKHVRAWHDVIVCREAATGRYTHVEHAATYRAQPQHSGMPCARTSRLPQQRHEKWRQTQRKEDACMGLCTRPSIRPGPAGRPRAARSPPACHFATCLHRNGHRGRTSVAYRIFITRSLSSTPWKRSSWHSTWRA